MRRMLVTMFFASFAAAAPGAPTGAEDTIAGSIVISGAWARASLGHAPNGSAYLTIQNQGAGDRLVGVRSPVARKVELHSHTMDGHTARMRPVAAIDIPAGATVKLDPSGLHVMFLALKAPLREGERVSLVLVFEKLGDVEVGVDVRTAPTQMPSH